MSDINIKADVFNLILDTMDNQMRLLRNIGGFSPQQAQLRTKSQRQSQNQPNMISCHMEIGNLNRTNEVLREQIKELQELLDRQVSQNEYDNIFHDAIRGEQESRHIEIEKLTRENETLKAQLVSQSDCHREYQNGFEDGLKAAQREMIVSHFIPTELEKAEIDDTHAVAASEAMLDEPVAHKVEEETVPDVEEFEERADIEETAEETAADAEETADDTVADADETTEGTAAPEENAADTEETAEDEELQEVEFNGKTYYYLEESGQIFLPTADGEVDLESPVGRWNEKKGDFVLFRTTAARV